MLGALALLAAACSGDSKDETVSAPTQTPEIVVQRPRLNYCPPGVGDEICDFAAAAEGRVQQSDAASLVGAGGPLDNATGRDALSAAIAAALPVSEAHPRTLRSITCPMVRVPPPEPNCTAKFGLVFATISEKEIDAGPIGILVLVFERAASGPRLTTHGIPEGPGRLYVIFGPRTTGGEVPGSDINGPGLGHGVYPVEVLAPGEEPYAPGAAEIIDGVEVRPLRIGGDTTLPDDVVVYLGPAPWAADSFAVLLWREYRGPDGAIRRDDLFGNAIAQHGPLGITAWAADEKFNDITLTACQEGACRGIGVGGWAGEFNVFRSIDGGITWTAAGRVPAMAFPKAVTGDGVIFGQYLARDVNERPVYRFFLHPSGREVPPPAPHTEPRSVPGLGVVWEPTYLGRSIGIEPSYDSAGNQLAGLFAWKLQARIAARFENGGIFASWTYTPDRPSDPHPAMNYIGRVEPSGHPSAIYSNETTLNWIGPFALGHRYLIGNAEVKPKPDSQIPFDVPAVLIDLATGFVSPLRELNAGLPPQLQPFVRGAVPGRVASVSNSTTCLNVREQATTTSASLGCYRDGVLLFERGETTTVSGVTWVAVTPPGGKPGWASAEFLERRAD
ncbi:SH3 domain-containing protein [Candidatus Amarobacter glycogenicus]|uniref:SH3 domain-containing protein n=1 Tax=Candidatus Amarobacter glycogenicus TaxID=3140699 RepID=UPI003135183D|nr:hypothetical protein [Dehalococcoidia bacterium]